MSLFNELKRRNVFRVSIAYVVLAWLLMQVADVILNNIAAPGWIFHVLLLFIAVGFPFAVFFAWAFELTPEGLKREHEVDRSQSITPNTGKKLDRVIIGVLILALGYFAWDKFVLSAGRETSAIESAVDHAMSQSSAEKISSIEALTELDKSIAVLPFVNMSNDPDQEYFSDGISEELLNVLAQYPDLRVAARTSSFQFKGENPDMAEIAEKLRVNHVLEGSVRKSGTRLRITAQLIETESGYHLWSESYDRELDDVFAIQDEISAAIGEALKIKLDLDKGADRTSPTVSDAANAEAFEAYVQGRQLINLRGRKNLDSAIIHLERALTADESYAPAHALLAIAITMLSNSPGSYGDLTLEEVRRRATPHINRAEELDTHLPEAFAARSLLSLLELDFDDAITNAKITLELNPSYADVINWLFISYMSKGRYLEATETLEHLLRVDPLSIPGRSNLAPRLALRGQPEAARAMADSMADLNPIASYTANGTISLESGKLTEALEWYLKSYAMDPENAFNNNLISQVFGQLEILPEALRLDSDLHHWAYLNAIMWPELLAVTRKRLERDRSDPSSNLFLANALHLSGQVAPAQPLYEGLLSRLSGQAIHDESLDSFAPTARAALGRLKSGDQMGAAVLVDLVREILDQTKRAELLRGEYYRTAAILEALEADNESALRNIEKAIDAGLRDRSLFSEPAFEGFREDREFLKQESRLKAMLATEREKALQMMCFSNPVPDAWQPLPETCTGSN